MKKSYPNGKCPDCFEKIPTKCKNGESCKNCGHVFYNVEIKKKKK